MPGCILLFPKCSAWILFWHSQILSTWLFSQSFYQLEPIIPISFCNSKMIFDNQQADFAATTPVAQFRSLHHLPQNHRPHSRPCRLPHSISQCPPPSVPRDPNQPRHPNFLPCRSLYPSFSRKTASRYCLLSTFTHRNQAEVWCWSCKISSICEIRRLARGRRAWTRPSVCLSIATWELIEMTWGHFLLLLAYFDKNCDGTQAFYTNFMVCRPIKK